MIENLIVYFVSFEKYNTLPIDRGTNNAPITKNGVDYLPGDIVCWNLGGAITHIGIVVNQKSTDGLRNLIVHNIGEGQVLADCLFSYKIIGHYSFQK